MKTEWKSEARHDAKDKSKAAAFCAEPTPHKDVAELREKCCALIMNE